MRSPAAPIAPLSPPPSPPPVPTAVLLSPAFPGPASATPSTAPTSDVTMLSGTPESGLSGSQSLADQNMYTDNRDHVRPYESSLRERHQAGFAKREQTDN